MKSQTLEAQLMSMCASSSQITQAFFQVKEELENENEHLEGQVGELRSRLCENEQHIEELERENGDIRSQVDELLDKVQALSRVLGSMQGQRTRLQRTADRWEDSLQQYADIDARE